MAAKASQRDIEDAIKEYLRGASAEDCATAHHTSEVRLAATLKARGLFRDKDTRRALTATKMAKTRRAMTPLPLEEIGRLYQSGVSELALARRFGVGRNVICVRLKHLGIARRSQREANVIVGATMPPAQRSRLAARFSARAGLSPSEESLVKRAVQRQRRMVNVSPAEYILAEWLTARGLPSVPQQAVGRYNVDIALGSIAIEVYGGGWHFSKNHAGRYKYLFDHGWSILIVVVAGKWSPLTEGAADDIHTFYQSVTAQPAQACQYRVIWGHGQLIATGGPYPYELAAVKPLRRPKR